MRTLVLLGATVTTGLIAGLFFAYSVSVMPGLHAAGDQTLVETMQRINVAILNGWFGAAFGGALVLSALSVVLHLGAAHRAPLPWVVAGLVLYVGVLAVTAGFNVPLNDALAAAGARAVDTAAGAAPAREHFETSWVRWNIVRTVLSLASFVTMAWALLVEGRSA